MTQKIMNNEFVGDVYIKPIDILRKLKHIGIPAHNNKNANIYLGRKYKLAYNIINEELPKTITSHYTEKELIPLYEKHGNWSKVAKELGVSHNGMYKHIRKLGLLTYSET